MGGNFLAEDNYIQKNIVIFFFSGTGNTWWVTKNISRALKNRGCRIRTISLENIIKTDLDKIIKEAHIVGLGYPIYGSDMPGIVKSFIKDLPEISKKSTFVFCTQWLFSGDGAAIAKNELNLKGYDVRWMEHFNMPNNVCVTSMWFFPYTNNKSRISSKLLKNVDKIDAFAGKILKGEKYLKGNSRFSSFLGGIQRVPFRRSFESFDGMLEIDENICIKCGQCVKFCPVGNIVIKEGKVVILSECILCLRCYDFCPVSALKFMGKNHNTKRGKPYKGPVDGFDPSFINKESNDEI